MRECAEGAPLRVAYFTRHTGTLWDWIAVGAHLGAPWTRINPGLFQGYGLNSSTAERVWREVGQLMCHVADVLVFSDTIPDARPLLQGGCKTPLVLQITNRFDYGVLPSDLPSYVSLMSEAGTWPHVWWVANNPYEEEYMARRGVKLAPPERRMMLRPVGACLLPDPPQTPPPTTAGAAASRGRRALEEVTAAVTEADAASQRVALLLLPYSRHLENTFIMPWLLRHGLTSHVQAYRQHYGGPAVLARHRGVITVPYQVSVMKMYEGLSAGAVFIIPSPQLFATMLGKLDLHHMSFCCRELLRDHPDNWTQFMDWYHPDFVSAHIVYDNLRELGRVIKDLRWSSALVSEKRRVGIAAMAASRQRTLNGYSSLFRAVRQQACAATAATPLPLPLATAEESQSEVGVPA